MIVKSMSRKDGSFRQLLDYVNRGTQEGRKLVWNLDLKGDKEEENEIVRTFEANASLRKLRKNGVALYHEMLSFSPDDARMLTADMVFDLAEAYLIRRAPNALAFGRIHWERNPHIHLVVSGNEIQSPTPTRISQGDFERVKRELEAYQRERYPELRSLVFEREKRKPKKRLAEAEQHRRLKKSEQPTKISEKERITAIVRNAFLESASESEWLKLLADHGLVFYHRGQDSHGLTDGTTGKKYRLKTLGLIATLKEYQGNWSLLEKRQYEMLGLCKEQTERHVAKCSNIIIFVILGQMR